MKINQRFLKFIMITVIPIFCMSCAIFGVALALESVNVDIDGAINYTPDLVFTPISGTTNCSVKAANTDITTANIPEQATISGETYTVTEIEADAFMYCDSLTSISIPASVIRINEGGYVNCEDYNCALDTVIFENNSNWLVDGEYYDEVSMSWNPVCEYFSSSQLSDPSTAATLLRRYSSRTTGYQRYNWSRELSFTFDTSLKTASVSSTKDNDNEGIAFGEVEIPSQITYNEGTYTVREIEADAFMYCDSLTSISIPASVIDIGVGAFYGCNLQSAKFKDTFDWVVEGYYFDENVEMQDVYISISSTDLSDTSTAASKLMSYSDYCSGDHEYAWKKVVSFSYTYNEYSKTARVTSATGSGHCDIPDHVIYNGETYTVNGIGTSCFANLNIVYLYIPKVIAVGKSAFSSCTQLIKVTSYADSFGSYAFSGCSNLKCAYLYDAGYIGSYAFEGCSSLTSGTVELSRYTDWYHSEEGFSINSEIVEEHTTWTEFSLSSNTVEALLTSTYVACDWSWSMAWTYGKLSFSYSSSNTGFTASVRCSRTSISGDVTIPSRVTYNGYVYTVTSIESGGFDNCQSITSVIIPYTIVRIENHAFYKCYSLAYFDAHWEGEGSLTYIGESAFAGTQFTSLFIPQSVTYIGNNCFGAPNGNVSGILSVSFADRSNWYLEKNGSYTAITISEVGEQNAIKFTAGWESGNLCKILPASSYSWLSYELVTSGENNVRVSATQGSMVPDILDIPARFSSDGRVYTVTQIADRAFTGRTNIRSVTFPDTLTSYIGGSAFQDCTNLTTVKFNSSSIHDIWGYAFRNTNIKLISLPNVVAKIWDYVFMDCRNLEQIVIPGVTEICSFAFRNCKKLNSITLPNNLTTIGAEAFRGSGLTSLYIPASVTSIHGNAFSNTPLAEMIVASGNSVYYSEKNGIYLKADDSLFKGCKSTVIKTGTTKIGFTAFEGCQMTSITIPSTVTTIGSYAFKESAITSITIPSRMTRIERNTFAGCKALESITIPSGITYIGIYAFTDSGLTKATFNATSGWSAGGTSLSNLSNTTTAANYLTKNYNTVEWTRS